MSVSIQSSYWGIVSTVYERKRKTLTEQAGAATMAAAFFFKISPACAGPTSNTLSAAIDTHLGLVDVESRKDP